VLQEEKMNTRNKNKESERIIIWLAVGGWQLADFFCINLIKYNYIKLFTFQQTANCQLPTANCQPPTANRQLNC
jgi:hypothetical protein